MIPGYRKRIVTNQNALREKAIIFENELDDRVVELIKLLYLLVLAPPRLVRKKPS